MHLTSFLHVYWGYVEKLQHEKNLWYSSGLELLQMPSSSLGLSFAPLTPINTAEM
jgi:hypothetical protein